jgi:hypothetical protein
MNNRVDNKVPLVVGVQYCFVFIYRERLLTSVHLLLNLFYKHSPCLYIAVVVVVVALEIHHNRSFENPQYSLARSPREGSTAFDDLLAAPVVVAAVVLDRTAAVVAVVVCW